MAIAASDAVPMPASTISGTFTCSIMSEIIAGFWMPEPGADRRAQRHDRDAAHRLQPLGRHRIVGAVDHHLEPVRISASAASKVAGMSG